MITDVPGVAVGHHTATDAATGCTVVLLPDATVGACVITGAAPATRETPVLEPSNLVDRVDAFVLSGGSAFGLAAADGVMDVLAERGVGLSFGGVVVPIVVGASLFDLGVGRSDVRPGPREGRAATESAGTHVEEGSVGAGTGATVGKWAGLEHASKGGVGTAARRVGDLVVGALVANNAVGDVLDEAANVLAGARTAQPGPWSGGPAADGAHPSTVLAVVATNARLDKAAARHAAAMSDAGIVRSVRPAHTSFDGDVVFCAATGRVAAEPWVVGALGAEVVAEAVRRSVLKARGLHGLPGLADR